MKIFKWAFIAMVVMLLAGCSFDKQVIKSIAGDIDKYNNCAQFYRHIKLDENIAKYYENEVKVLQKEGEAKLSKLPEAQQEELAQWYKEQHKSVPWMHSSEWVYKFWGSIMCWPVK